MKSLGVEFEMIDETNLARAKQRAYEKLAEKVITSLKSVNINGYYVHDRQEALTTILSMVPQGATVSWGDSVTLHQIGVMSSLKERNLNPILDPFERNAEGYYPLVEEERVKLMRQALTADVFLSGANAITVDGRLVNVDGRGNRVAGTIFGPNKVIIAAGCNKIVSNVDQALERLKRVAVLNAIRHVDMHHYTHFERLPCAKLGYCVDCRTPARICRITTIIEGSRDPQRLHVVLIGEDLGI